MRLHALTIQAVGPFAGRHDIDFAELAAGGLFLLEGPTGAGKSTIIDAIVFALYGKVAGAGASEDRLRSAFAPEDVETVVDLVFETGVGVYRVRRTPAYDRVKKRGSGSTRQQATVKLWRLGAVPDGPADAAVGDVVSTRLDEVGLEIVQAVGLDRTQFVQTMVLPQGEFASFLRADPEQRRGLLQRIFGTEVYERVQQRLEEQRRRCSAGSRTPGRGCRRRCPGSSVPPASRTGPPRTCSPRPASSPAPCRTWSPRRSRTSPPARRRPRVPPRPPPGGRPPRGSRPAPPPRCCAGHGTGGRCWTSTRR
jgi:exonuclease SbcC